MRISPSIILSALLFTMAGTLNAQTTAGPTLQAVQKLSEADLFPAALEGNAALIKKGLAEGFNPNHQDPDGRTLLMMAAYNGKNEIAKRLLDAGANVNQQDQGGSTALMWAASGPFKETVQLLLDKGAGINTIDNNEHFTALMWAAAEGQTENVKLLLQYKANPTLTDVDGDSAASFAAQRGHQQLAKLLKEAMESWPTTNKTQQATAPKSAQK